MIILRFELRGLAPRAQNKNDANRLAASGRGDQTQIERCASITDLVKVRSIADILVSICPAESVTNRYSIWIDTMNNVIQTDKRSTVVKIGMIQRRSN